MQLRKYRNPNSILFFNGNNNVYEYAADIDTKN